MIQQESEFQAFPKIARLSRECCITEKIGRNPATHSDGGPPNRKVSSPTARLLSSRARAVSRYFYDGCL